MWRAAALPAVVPATPGHQLLRTDSRTNGMLRDIVYYANPLKQSRDRQSTSRGRCDHGRLNEYEHVLALRVDEGSIGKNAAAGDPRYSLPRLSSPIPTLVIARGPGPNLPVMD